MADAWRRSGSAAGERADGLPACRLDVYVGSHCPNCEDALQLADEAAAQFPGIVVRVIDLDMDSESWRLADRLPEGVVAVPTYVLNGRVIALGNPDPEELFARLHEAGG